MNPELSSMSYRPDIYRRFRQLSGLSHKMQ
jgi:hypothetical protein